MGHKKPTVTTKSYLENAPLPNHGKSYTVVTHKEVIDNTLTLLRKSGFTVQREIYRANTNATIEDSLESLADLIKENLWNNHTLNWIDEGTHKYLKSPRTAINNVLFSGDVINRSEAYTLKYKIDEICAIISEDGKGVHDYKVHGKTIKAIKT